MKKLVSLVFVCMLVGWVFLVSFSLSNDYFSEMAQQEKECLAGLYLSYIGCVYMCQGEETEEKVDRCLTGCENMVYRDYLRCLSSNVEENENQK
jgi:putative Mn2+ efflux pump MntP